MQSRWKTCPQTPHAMLKPGCSGSPVGFACIQEEPLVGAWNGQCAATIAEILVNWAVETVLLSPCSHSFCAEVLRLAM